MHNRTFAALLIAGVLAAACGQPPAEPPPTPSPPPPPARTAAPKPTPPPPHAMPTEATTRSLARDGATIRYRVYGQGEPAVVLIHGWSCDSGYWDSQLDALAVEYTVVTLDLAGHGRSATGGRKDWSMANFGADVAAVVQAAGHAQVVLVGHSMGGPVALEAARQLPGRVLGIVGVDTLREIAHPFPKEMTEPILAAMRKDFKAATADFVDRSFFTAHTDPVVRKWIVEDMASAPARVAIPAIERLVVLDFGPLVAELDLPVVAINADAPPTDEPAIRRIEPRFRVVTMAGVGHFPMIEKPAEFNTMLLRIVAAWAPPTTSADAPLSADAQTR